MWPMWGPTTLIPGDHRAAVRTTDVDMARRLSSVGQPVRGVEVQIRSEDGRVLGPRQTGELSVRGDVAFVDDEAYLYIGGRSDDTIIRGGENIAPAELEDVLVDHPCVGDCAVVGVADPERGSMIVAVVVPAEGADPEPEELREYVRERLCGSHTPDRVVFRANLSTNATGKVLRRELVNNLTPVSEETAWSRTAHG